MTPFFKGNVTQNVNPVATSAILGTMTGLKPVSCRKQEREPLFKSEQSMPLSTFMPFEAWREHITAPVSRNNETPIQPVLVGPGIDKGYTQEPSDVYFDQREYELPGSTDDVYRTADRPKMSFEGRLIPGQGPVRKALPGKVEKHRPPTMREVPADYYQPTTGAVLGETSRPEFEDRPQAREATSRDYTGGAKASQRGCVSTPATKAPSRHALRALRPGPSTNTHAGRGACDDKGRASIVVYDTARSLTTTKVYQGNVASLVKSITAPVVDALRPTRLACPHAVLHPREDGNLAGPSRIRVYDPDDIARTTTRESFNFEGGGGALAGPVRGQVHDPDDVSRTTIRETLDQESGGSVRVAAARGVVTDPDDLARTTLRQTALNEAQALNLRGPSQNIAYDPDDVTRTTVRETLVDEAQGVNLRGPTRSLIYDPDDILRTTIRETMSSEETGAVNLRPPNTGHRAPSSDDARRTVRETLFEPDGSTLSTHVPASAVWDPDALARTTIREVMSTEDNGPGQVGGVPTRGGYVTASVEAGPTLRELNADIDYYGQGARDKGSGYVVTAKDVKPTQKAILSDGDYFGPAGDAHNKPTSHDEYENAKTNQVRERVLESRTPTQTSVKVNANASLMGEIGNRRQELQPPPVPPPSSATMFNECAPGGVTKIPMSTRAGGEGDRRFLTEVAANAIQRVKNDVALPAFASNPR